jgi:hypothetical protein
MGFKRDENSQRQQRMQAYQKKYYPSQESKPGISNSDLKREIIDELIELLLQVDEALTGGDVKKTEEAHNAVRRELTAHGHYRTYSINR